MNRKWWKEAVIYQIYPRSFYDSNGDGIGDIKGIIEKLDYIKELGIDVIWLCPVYKSPNDDNGYDISDYCGIMDEFGTMEEFDELLNKAHSKGLKVIMDLVVNHTSDEHQWFIEARSSKDSEKRDYYIWMDAKNGEEPNNWGSFFSPSVWEWDEKTGQYFLHLFSRKQPDLNWKNPVLRKEIYDMMKWWLDKGIDGFRMDVINAIAKNWSFPDAPRAEHNTMKYVFYPQYYFNQPGVHELIQEMNREVLSKYDIMTVGEACCVTTEMARLYTGEDRNELNMVFQFELMEIDTGEKWKWDIVPWKLTVFKRIMSKWQKGLHNTGWNSLYLNNHDQPRMVSRFGNDKEYRVESAKMLATLLHTLQGTPYIYQGEEIGMTNVKFDSIEDYRDIETINFYNIAVNHEKIEPNSALQSIYKIGRDNARTPMQWNDEENAGFTAGKPWIKLNPNYRSINVKQAMENKDSIFHYYKKLIALRKENLTMVYGDYTLLLEDDEEIYSYIRELNGNRLLVILNFFDKEPVWKLPEGIKYKDARLLLSNYEVEQEEEISEIKLRPYEARVYELI
ncbi:MAG: glycoside hydrolase family 13 protein [Acetivibrionales bacterium]|jgi:oligo-1,6-glucosidase|nr:alpha-glucosidase [Clostridiaceae bacterium]